MTNFNNLKFWPWIWSEKKLEILAVILFIAISAYNLYNRNFSIGFMVVYLLAMACCIVVFVGIKIHWNQIKKLKNKQ